MNGYRLSCISSQCRIIRVPPVCVSASFSSEGEDDTSSVIRKSTLVSVDMLGAEQWEIMYSHMSYYVFGSELWDLCAHNYVFFHL